MLNIEFSIIQFPVFWCFVQIWLCLFIDFHKTYDTTKKTNMATLKHVAKVLFRCVSSHYLIIVILAQLLFRCVLPLQHAFVDSHALQKQKCRTLKKRQVAMVSLSFLCFLYMSLRICSYRAQVIFVIFLRIGVYVRSRIKLFCVTLHNLLSLIVDIFLYDLIICLKHSAHIISILIIGLLYCLGNDVQDCGFDLASFHAFAG